MMSLCLWDLFPLCLVFFLLYFLIYELSIFNIQILWWDHWHPTLQLYPPQNWTLAVYGTCCRIFHGKSLWGSWRKRSHPVQLWNLHFPSLPVFVKWMTNVWKGESTEIHSSELPDNYSSSHNSTHISKESPYLLDITRRFRLVF